MGFGYSPDGHYEMPLIGEQSVKIRWYYYDPGTGTSATGWYGGTSFADALAVPIPKHGTVTLDLTIPVS